MLGKSNEFFSVGNNAEDSLKFHVVKKETPEVIDKMMFKESAKRVLFTNCLEYCGLQRTDIKNFNRHFYYNMKRDQVCI